MTVFVIYVLITAVIFCVVGRYSKNDIRPLDLWFLMFWPIAVPSLILLIPMFIFGKIAQLARIK